MHSYYDRRGLGPFAAMSKRSVHVVNQPFGIVENDEEKKTVQTHKEYAICGYARMYALTSAHLNKVDSRDHRQLAGVNREVAFSWKLLCFHRKERAAGRPGIFHVGVLDHCHHPPRRFCLCSLRVHPRLRGHAR